MCQDLRRVAARLGGINGARLPARTDALCRYSVDAVICGTLFRFGPLCVPVSAAAARPGTIQQAATAHAV